MVVAEAVPVLGSAAADSDAGGGEAVGDDAANVRYMFDATLLGKKDKSYASMAVPQPDCELAEEVAAALDVVD